MTDETTEPALTWTEVTVPPNIWTKAMLTGDPVTDDWAGIEVIEVFHANPGALTFDMRADMVGCPRSDDVVEVTDGWRARKTPYIDWVNRQYAERAAAEQLEASTDLLAGHPLAKADVQARNVEQGHIKLEDDGNGAHRVVLTERGAARARELLGLPADFPLNEV